MGHRASAGAACVRGVRSVDIRPAAQQNALHSQTVAPFRAQYATEELCARWIAVGAWYPYTRSHHADGFQELFR
jgi:hypothetical protein